MSAKPSQQLLTVDEVREITGLSRATIYRRFAAREFPQPLKIGHSVRWRLKTLMDWIDRRDKVNTDMDAHLKALAEV